LSLKVLSLTPGVNLISSKQFSLRKMDFAIFCVLFVFVISYQIQLLFPAFATFYLREILYAYLYVRVLFFYKHRFSSFVICMGTFVFVSLLAAVNTFFQYQDFGLPLAIGSLLRFLNVALLAPLAAVLLQNVKRVRFVLGLWASVVFVGFLTVFYQFNGGDIQWLVQKYIAIRANLVRYKSFLGEPNVGGMCAVLLLVIAFWGTHNKPLRWIGIGVAYFCGLMSLSKAAFIGGLIVCLFVAFYESFNFEIKKVVLPNRRLRENFLVLGFWVVIFLFSAPLFEYAVALLRSFSGNEIGEPSALLDFRERAVSMKYGGDFGDRAFFVNYDPFFKYVTWLKNAWFFIGQSFGRAGSVALAMNVPKAVGPHNGYLEMFIVGGFFMLGAFLTMQWLTLKTFVKTALTGDSTAKTLLLLFVILSIFMLGYPNIYEPVTGSLFWVLIGVGAAGELFKIEQLAEVKTQTIDLPQ